MKKYLLALAAAALCLGVVASCEKDDEKDKESERETTLVEEDNTLKFLEGAWISDAEVMVPYDDTVHRYYFLYVDEQAKGKTGYESYLVKNGVEVEGSRGHRYYSFYYKLRKEEDGRIRGHSFGWGPEYQYATITSYTDTTITFESYFSWAEIVGPVTMKKTDVQVRWW